MCDVCRDRLCSPIVHIKESLFHVPMERFICHNLPKHCYIVVSEFHSVVSVGASEATTVYFTSTPARVCSPLHPLSGIQLVVLEVLGILGWVEGQFRVYVGGGGG